MHTPAPIVSPEMAFASFDLVSFGEITVPEHPLRFGFQVDIVPEAEVNQQLIFALVSQNRGTEGRAKTHGFAIRLDLKTGEVWDLLSDSGLIGWIDGPVTRFTDEEPLLLSWQVEHLGAALIPKLQIGDEVFLYPALRYEEGMVMDTMAGTLAGKTATLSAFMHPAVWRESLV